MGEGLKRAFAAARATRKPTAEMNALSKAGLEAATLSALPAKDRMWAIAEAIKSAYRSGVEDSAKDIAALEVPESDGNDQWWQGWNAAIEQAVINIRSLTKPANEGKG